MAKTKGSKRAKRQKPGSLVLTGANVKKKPGAAGKKTTKKRGK
jgi:hypothetical protein